MSSLQALLFILLLVAAGAQSSTSSSTDLRPSDGRRFIGIRSFEDWISTQRQMGIETIYTSPEIDAGLPWNELVVSWNAAPSSTRYLTIQAQAVYPDRETKWYILGRWSDAPSRQPRESVTKQKDADGDVETDTLALVRHARRVRLRVTAGGETPEDSQPPRFLGVSFLDKAATPRRPKALKTGWGRSLDVPRRSQLAYEGGKVWCSPTSTSMVLGYWARKLKRPELDRSVPSVAKAVYDPNWPGTGNWPFNTAYAGSLPGMRAYVTRLAGVWEMEEWVRAGVPVVCSVSYRLLYGKPRAETGGHIVVCVGFTKNGDVIVNDPWAELKKGDSVRVTIPRSRFKAACAKSSNTVYLIYPIGWKVPANQGGRWE